VTSNRLTLGVDYGLCECRCGEKTIVSHKTDRSKGWVKGEPYIFKSGHATLTNSQALIDVMIAMRLLMGERRRERIDFILAHSGFVRFEDEE
jgi:hypothetical protein